MAKKRPKKSEQNVAVGIHEPVRKSLYDLVEQNLAAANRKIYVIRVTIVGEHSFDTLPDHPIEQVFENIVNQVNSGYVDEHLTGLLLYYQKYYCHLLEGSESAIYKFLELLLENEEFSNCIGQSRILELAHHLKQRIMFGWFTYTGMPPKLLEELNPDAPFAECRATCFNSIIKMQNLACSINREKMKEREKAKEAAEIEDVSDTRSSLSSEMRLPASKRSTFMSGMSLSFDKHREHLIEIGKIEFLTKTYYLTDLREYYAMRDLTVTADYYRDCTWPIETDFIPYDVFDKPCDPITDLPTRGIVKEEEDEVTEFLEQV